VPFPVRGEGLPRLFVVPYKFLRSRNSLIAAARTDASQHVSDARAIRGIEIHRRGLPVTRFGLCAAGCLAAGLAAVAPAHAQQPVLVPDWGANGVPTTIDMSIYVPQNVADTPPVLVVIHYCGGSASAVFGQANGGGLVAAANEYGFIMVLPSAKEQGSDKGRCWDVQSNQTRTRDGGGDSHAIRQMVTYAVNMRGGNPDRVYATGDSSGGMMTELLLALYPDVFKAGSAMAGMPAGCRGDGETGTGGGYSGACAGGSVLRTPEEWGDIARMMHPGYTGYRPRVQLFHGDADNLIRIANHTEAIDQWTNVLGLSTTPTMTNMGVELGNHQATRQRWEGTCGDVVLDAFTSIGGDHGPSDALFLAEYIVPFMGLDDTGLVDPGVARCSASSGGAGGMGAGGASGASGASGAGAGAGGAAGDGGAAAAAGAGGLVAGAGGMPVAGAAGLGGGAGTDGASGSAGSAGLQGAGGSTGGAAGSGGKGGATATGGTAGSGAGVSSGAASGRGGSTDAPPVQPPADESGCACTTAGSGSRSSFGAALALGALAWMRSRRRGRSKA
jgi:acetylxylan esterase